MREIEVVSSGDCFEAKGRFVWKRAKPTWILASGLEGFWVEGERWTIRDACLILLPHQSEYQFEASKGGKAKILFHGSLRPSATVSCEEADYEIDLTGAMGIMRAEGRDEVLRIAPTWRDSDSEAGVSCRITYREGTSSLLLALACGAFLLQHHQGLISEALFFEGGSQGKEVGEEQDLP